MRSGLLQIPRFQRKFVWDHRDRIALMRSILQGIPLGSILTWRTTQVLRVFDEIGPHRIPRPAQAGRAVPEYVLDGHQRLSTLFGALVPAQGASPHAHEWTIYADLDVELEDGKYKFELHRSTRKARPTWLALSRLFDSQTLLRFQRALHQHFKDEARVDALVERSDRLATIFRRYRVPVVPLVTEDVGLACQTFVLINQAGMKMSEADLINALYVTGDLTETLRNQRDTKLAPVGWGELDDQWILDACKVAVDQRLGLSNPQELVKKFGERPGLLAETVDYLVMAATFLKDECGIPAPGLLPYEQFVALLAEFFRLCPSPSVERVAWLRRWFWSTTYHLASTSFTFSAIRKATLKVRDIAINPSPDISVLREIEDPPARIVTRGARARALGLQLLRLRPQQSSGDLLCDVRDFGDSRGLLSLLAGVKSDGEDDDDGIGSQIGNRIIADRRDLAKIRTLLRSTSAEPPAGFLASHAIGPDALAALRANNFTLFIRLRGERISAQEREFLVAENVLNELSDGRDSFPSE